MDTNELISEKNYRSSMDNKVLPFLEQNKKCSYFNPDGKGTVYYEQYCQPQAKGCIVMIHGFSESAEKYAELIYYFFRNGYQVYIPDVRGHGRSVRTENDLSLIHIDHYERYLDDLEYLTVNIVKKENPHLPLYLYGHSMGGGICAAFLEKRPDLFPKAILSSPMIRPLTGGIPFGLARIIAITMSALGKGHQYVAGHHEFRADETFENSAATSAERYDYYYQKRCADKYFQTSGASYCWLREATGLSAYILKKPNCRKIRTQILLFQAQQDDFVSRKAQECFAGQVKRVRLVPVAETKHEIYMSSDGVLHDYIEQILTFLS